MIRTTLSSKSTDAARAEAATGSTKRAVAEVSGTTTMLEAYEAHFLPIKVGVETGNYKEVAASHLETLLATLQAHGVDKVMLAGFEFAALEEPSKRGGFAKQLVNDLDAKMCSLGAKKTRTGGA